MYTSYMIYVLSTKYITYTEENDVELFETIDRNNRL